MTAVAKLPEKWRNEADSIHVPPYDDSENSNRAIAMHCCADELEAALSPAELGWVEEGVEAIQRLLDCAELAVGFRGFQADDDNEVVVLRDAIREAKLHIVSLSTPRAAGAVTDYPAKFKRRLQVAVDGIVPPKMSPLKTELFKAGCFATIRAINAELERAALTPPSAKGENK